MFVAGDHVRIREVCFQGFGLGGLAGLAGFDLDDLHRPQAKGSPGGRGAGDVGLHELRLGAAGKAANRDDGDLQGVEADLPALCPRFARGVGAPETWGVCNGGRGVASSQACKSDVTS